MTASTKEERNFGSDRLRRLFPYVGLALFAGALYLIYREVRGFQFGDVVAYLGSLSAARVMLAVALTGANFWLLTAYDRLAMTYVGARLPYRRVAFTSFIAYSFSIALGHAYLTGGAVRYRLYSLAGLSGTDITRIILFCGLSFWIGYALLGGVLFTIAPFPLPPELALPVSLRPLGMLLLGLLVMYLVMSAAYRRPVRLREWTLEIPNLRLTIAQGLIAAADLLLSATILYILLPISPEVSLAHVLGVFLLAIIAGLISQVPGGLGVFDSVILILLTPPLDPAPVLGALLAFRSIYYLLPLLVGALVFTTSEIMRQRQRVQDVSRRLTQTLPRTVPPVLAMLTFMAGLLVLTSTVLPMHVDRLAFLSVPLLVAEAAHVALSATGMLLLFISIGVHRKLTAAYVAALGLLAVAGLAALLRGGYEEAIAVSTVAIAFLPCRSFFYRRRPIFAEPFGGGFASALVAVVVIMTWLGLLIYPDIELTPRLLLEFGDGADAARFGRTLAAATSIGLVAAAAHRLMPRAPEGVLLNSVNEAKVEAIVASSLHSNTHLAFLGDKYLLFQDDSAFIMYGVRGRNLIAMGDPVGPARAREELAWQFRSIASRRGGICAFYEVSTELAPLYLDLGLALFKLGEEARVRLDSFRLESDAQSGLQQNLSRQQSAGLTFDVVPATDVEPLLPRLRQISEAWLTAKSARERTFSLGHFSEDYIRRTPVATVSRNGTIVAFANLWTTASRHELAIDLLRYDAAAPTGVMDFLFTSVMSWGRKEGYAWFNLGMAPLREGESHALLPVWTREGSLLYRHGEHFYSFHALRGYKQKFDPVWETRYIAAPGGVALPRILRDASSLVSGGIPKMLVP